MASVRPAWVHTVRLYLNCPPYLHKEKLHKSMVSSQQMHPIIFTLLTTLVIIAMCFSSFLFMYMHTSLVYMPCVEERQRRELAPTELRELDPTELESQVVTSLWPRCWEWSHILNSRPNSLSSSLDLPGNKQK